MNVWTALPRVLASSRCPQNVRFLVEESLSSRFRHYSTITPVSSKPPDGTHFYDLAKEALARTDSIKQSSSSKEKTKWLRRRKKRTKEEKKAASKNNTDSTTSKKQKSLKLAAEPIPPLDESANDKITGELEKALTAFPTEQWSTEPWWTNQQTEDPPEEIDRASPPHFLQQVIFSEGTLNPSVPNNLVDVPTVVEHLPVARLSHGLERVLFKYVNLPLARLF